MRAAALCIAVVVSVACSGGKSRDSAAAGDSLLFIGDDFRKTDIAPAS